MEQVSTGQRLRTGERVVTSVRSVAKDESLFFFLILFRNHPEGRNPTGVTGLCSETCFGNDRKGRGGFFFGNGR